MITDKDRIDFLQRLRDEGRTVPARMTMTLVGEKKCPCVRQVIDLDMAQWGDWDFPDIYCKCGVGYTDWDIEYLECLRSTPKQWNPGSQSESWTSWYKCSGCGEEIEIEEGT